MVTWLERHGKQERTNASKILYVKVLERVCCPFLDLFIHTSDLLENCASQKLFILTVLHKVIERGYLRSSTGFEAVTEKLFKILSSQWAKTQI